MTNLADAPAFTVRRLLLASLAVFTLLAPAEAPAQEASARIADARPGEVRVLASTGLRAVLEAAQADAAKAVGRPVVIQFGASRALQAVIESDQPFEVAIVTPEVLEGGIAKGAVRSGSRQDVARTAVALAQRGGARADIATPQGLKAALQGAKAIRYNPIGSGRPTIDAMFAGVGVDPASLGARIRPLPTAADPPATLGAGEYELTIVLDSEVPTLAPGAMNLGPIPAPFQMPVVMSAGVGAKGDARSAQALIDFLKGPEVTRVLLANRMSRVGAGGLAQAQASVQSPPQSAPFDITSTAFRDGGVMALKYSGNRKESANCLGSNVSPELSWANPPPGVRSYALFLQDPEGRLGLGVIHWVAYGIAPSIHGFAEGELSVPSSKYVLGKAYYEGATTYIGPCPPPGSAAHHYVFTIIATDLAPDALPPGLTLAELLDRLNGHAKAAASLVGTFKHP